MQKHYGKSAIALFSIFCIWSVAAQAISRDDLASQIEAAHAEQLSGIERVAITSEISTGVMAGMTSTGRFVKDTEDGQPVLREVGSDDHGTMNLAGMHDGTLPKMVRNSSSIERGRIDGERVYIVLVDDVDFLKSLEEINLSDDLLDEEFEPKSVRLWLAASDFTARKLEYVQSGPGGGDMTVTVTMADYEEFEGLPIAKQISIHIAGMEQMIAPEDLQEMRQQMKMMQEQLAMMPDEQRAMIEATLAPQIAQFEEMMSAGGTQFEIRIVDVKVN